jgi:cyclopropane fatty-acyl-phospholipid synthase-like methyltransferase
MHQLSMNSAKGKEILSLIRNGDFAHPGELEAVQAVFSKLGIEPQHAVLDVGCGRGGTAAAIYNLGYEQVSGFDIDRESISYAKSAYPHLDFKVCSIAECSSKYRRTFDILCLFNVYYALTKEEQRTCLQRLYKLSHPETILIIFDYTARGATTLRSPVAHSGPRTPIKLDTFTEELLENCWRVSEFVDYTSRYREWYFDLVARIEGKKDQILKLADMDWFLYVKAIYQNLLTDITTGNIGGGAFYLKPVA